MKRHRNQLLCLDCVQRGPQRLHDGQYLCPLCGHPRPTRFVEERLSETLIVPVGLPGHGKTLYLTVLLGSLIDGRTHNLGDGCLMEPVNPEAFELIRGVWGRMKGGELPPGTLPNAFSRPSVAQFSHLGPHRSGYLVLFDIGGGTFEHYDPRRLDPRVLRFLAECDGIMVCYSAVEPHGAPNLQMLMQAYKDHTVFRPGGRATLKQKRVVVVYTKGDLLAPKLRDSGYADVANYLVADPEPVNDGYHDVLRYISDRLADFTCRAIPGGRGFHAMCAQQFGSLEYCIVSALGSNPDANNRMRERLNPRRVVYPLLLAMGR